MLVEEGKIQLTIGIEIFTRDEKFAGQRGASRSNFRSRNLRADSASARNDGARPAAPCRGTRLRRNHQNAPVKEASTKGRDAIAQVVRDYDSREMTPQEQVERFSKAPLPISPAPCGSTA